jgi:chromate transport protein ChrA
MTADRRAAQRRYTTRFMIAMTAYTVLILLMVYLIKRVEPPWLKALMALVPAIPIAVVLSELLRFLASQDELERRMQFEAAAEAAILTCGLTFAWGLLEIAGMPRLPVIFVLPIFCSAYGYRIWRATRRYQ